MMNRIVPLLGAVLMATATVPVINPSPLIAAGIFKVSDRQVDDLLNRLEKDANAFRKSFDHALDRSRLNGSRREDDLNAYVGDFENATDDLQKQFDRNRRVAGDVQEVLDRGSRIEREMPRRGDEWDRANRDWEFVRRDLNDLARITYGTKFPNVSEYPRTGRDIR
jgi:hypothetical protein